VGGNERMLAMPEVDYIKHLREKEDLSINEIARKTGRNWRTVKKYADGESLEETLTFRKRGMMYEEGYGEIVDYWLEIEGTNHKIQNIKRRAFGFRNLERFLLRVFLECTGKTYKYLAA
jgi:predicted transcriptional regulator